VLTRTPMPILAAVPAALAPLPLSGLGCATQNRPSCHGGLRLGSSLGVLRGFNLPLVSVELHSRSTNEHFSPLGVFRSVSRLLIGHCFGASPAPGGARSSACGFPPLPGQGSSPNKFEIHVNERRPNFFRAPP
jgi:hypothetical protein